MTPPVKPEEKPPVGGTGAGGEGAGGEAFDRGKLNPVIRDMTPEQINDLLETMSAGLRAKREVVEERQPAPPAQKEPEPPGDMKELMNPASEKYDPEKALDYIIRKNYGGVVRDLQEGTLQGTYAALRQEYSDFKDFEPDIRKALAGENVAAVTPQRVLATYFQAKGIKLTLEERSKKAKEATGGTMPPSPPAPPKKEEELTAVEVEVAQRMFRRAADPVKEYKDYLARIDRPMEMQVPVGDGKKE